MNVALLQAPTQGVRGPDARALARALGERGHGATVLSSHRGPSRTSVEEGVQTIYSRRWPEAPLRFRGFTGPLTPIPQMVAQLLRGRYDLAHAFSPPDALAALWWQRLTGRPVVFTWSEHVSRESLADRRLRLRLVEKAIADANAVVAPDHEAAAQLRRWLMIEPTVIDGADGAAHERMYKSLRRPADHHPRSQ